MMRFLTQWDGGFTERDFVILRNEESSDEEEFVLIFEDSSFLGMTKSRSVTSVNSPSLCVYLFLNYFPKSKTSKP